MFGPDLDSDSVAGWAMGGFGRGEFVRTDHANSWQAHVSLHGEIDGVAAPVVRAELERHVTAGRRVLRVDTADVDFVDTTALSVLLTLHWHCLRQGGTLMLSGVRDPLRRLLSITGLDGVLLVDRAEAHVPEASVLEASVLEASVPAASVRR